MTQTRKEELQEIIEARILKLTEEEDDEAYALFSPEEYYAIPDDMKPEKSSNIVKTDIVKIALEQAAKVFDKVNPVAIISGPDYVEWCVAMQSVAQALASVQDRPYQNSNVVSIRAVRIICTTNGQEFPSIAAAARFCGVTAPMISNHLAGRPGYGHVRGHKFEKIS